MRPRRHKPLQKWRKQLLQKWNRKSMKRWKRKYLQKRKKFPQKKRKNCLKKTSLLMLLRKLSKLRISQRGEQPKTAKHPL